MMNFYVDLNNIDDIKFFVKQAEKYPCDIIVRNIDRIFSIDGSSIMGVLSLNLSEPVEVIIKDKESAESFKEDIYRLII